MKNRKTALALSAILSFFTCFSISSGYVLSEPVWSDSGSLMTFLLFLLLTAVYRRVLFPFHKGRFFASFLFGMPMGMMVLLGVRYGRDIQLSYNMWCFLLALSGLSLLFGAFIGLLFQFLPGTEAGLRSLLKTWEEKIYGERKILFISGPHGGLRLFSLILFCTGAFYFLTFLAVYPGIYSYDASVQVLQFFGEEPLTAHHPLLHTLFFCGSLKLGDVLFGSFQTGMAIHSILQAAMAGAAFSYVIWWMLKRRCPLILVILSYMLLVINPYMQIFVFVTTKDVLFGAVFLLLFLFAIEMAEDLDSFFKSRLRQLRFFLTALLMCFLRNQGIYVFLFFGLFHIMFLLKRKKEKALKWGLTLFAAAAFYMVITGPLFALFGVEKGDSREMLSVPMQQLARAYSMEAEQLNQEETTYIETLILPDNLEQYISVNADPVKSGFQTEVVKEDPGRFIKTWLDIGIKTPITYADSFFMGNWGYWYPEETQYWINYIMFNGAFMDPQYNILNIRRDSRLPAYEGFLREISLTPAFEDIPVISLLLNQAFPFWLMVLYASVCLHFRRYRYLLPLLLLTGYWGTLLLGPVTSVRYALPLMMCVPLLFMLLFEREHRA